MKRERAELLEELILLLLCKPLKLCSFVIRLIWPRILWVGTKSWSIMVYENSFGGCMLLQHMVHCLCVVARYETRVLFDQAWPRTGLNSL